MTIRFTCQACGKALKADDSKAGKRVKCPDCMDVVTIPVPKVEAEDEFDLGGYDDGYGDEELDTPPRRTLQKPKPKAKPKKKRVKQVSRVDAELAPRYRRLIGALADFFTPLFCLVPSVVVASFMGNPNQLENQRPSPIMSVLFLGLIFLGMVAPIIGNICLYATRSQSIGKFLLGMQVVDYETREPAGFLKGFLLRNVGVLMMHFVPLGGIADALFIFGDENRCIHDHIASTSVVDIS